MLAALASRTRMVLLMACGGSRLAASTAIPKSACSLDRRCFSSTMLSPIAARRDTAFCMPATRHGSSHCKSEALRQATESSSQRNIRHMHVRASGSMHQLRPTYSGHRSLPAAAAKRRAATTAEDAPAAGAATAEEEINLDEDGEFDFGSDEEFDEKLGFDDADFDEDTFDDFEPDNSSGWAAEGSVVDASGAMINTGRADWGEVGLTIARRILDQQPALQLFSLRAHAVRRRLDIAIDKPEDRFGSPTTEDLDAFVREFARQFEEALGEALAGDIDVEVSSPGAERAVRVPQDWERFRELPMAVVYRSAADGGAKPKEQEKVLMLKEVDEAVAVTRWHLADVRFNREAAGKGRRLGKKKLQEVYEIPVADLVRVNLHLDI